MKEVKDNINRWKDILWSWLEKQYSENNSTTKSNQQIQCSPYQITISFPTELEKKFTIFVETQRTLNSQNNLRKEERSWRNQFT